MKNSREGLTLKIGLIALVFSFLGFIVNIGYFSLICIFLGFVPLICFSLLIKSKKTIKYLLLLALYPVGFFLFYIYLLINGLPIWT